MICRTSATRSFCPGTSFLTGGALLSPQDHLGRDPQISSAFCKGGRLISLSTAYLNYYLTGKSSDGLFDESIMFGITAIGNDGGAKLAFEYFNFMNIYSEKDFKFSLAKHFSAMISGGLNLSVCKKGLLVGDFHDEYSIIGSSTLVLYHRKVSLSLELGGMRYLISRKIFLYDMLTVDIKGGTISTKRTNQGVFIKVYPFNIKYSRISWAMSFSLWEFTRSYFNVSTNPFSVGLGLSFKLNRSGIYAGTLSHPVLGTSLGIGMEHLIMKR